MFTDIYYSDYKKVKWPSMVEFASLVLEKLKTGGLL